MKQKNEPINYKIKYEDEENYTLKIYLKSNERILKLILERSLLVLNQKKGIDIKNKDLDHIKEFTINRQDPQLQRYMALLKQAIRGPFKDVVKDCKKIDNRSIDRELDGFILDKVHYQKEGGAWAITFHIKGLFIIGEP